VARVEAMEVAVLEAKAHLYGEMFHARREALRLRRLIEPALSVLELLRDHRFPGGDREASPYLGDLVARLKRILAEVEAVRDGLTEMVEGYASVVANRLNRVMRFLTVLSTIFLPATLIASIYGMNFSIPEYHWPNGYAFSLALMIAVSGGLVLYMSRKGWFR
jgi:magnesium transporter